ncbi:MAG TPA: hypothetical protein VNT20_18295 [Flavisolibacter sp.]|nr:hypothetical protein [Flavisolibacter sp.]
MNNKNYQQLSKEELLTKASEANLNEEDAYQVAMALEKKFPSPANTSYHFPKQLGSSYRFVSFTVNVNH